MVAGLCEITVILGYTVEPQPKAGLGNIKSWKGFIRITDSNSLVVISVEFFIVMRYKICQSDPWSTKYLLKKGTIKLVGYLEETICAKAITALKLTWWHIYPIAENRGHLFWQAPSLCNQENKLSQDSRTKKAQISMNLSPALPLLRSPPPPLWHFARAITLILHGGVSNHFPMPMLLPGWPGFSRAPSHLHNRWTCFLTDFLWHLTQKESNTTDACFIT